jgi:uncharacterized protein (TIGR02678 family)
LGAISGKPSVGDTALAEHLAAERSRAVRSLLAEPLLDAEAHPDEFRLVARHASWLVDYFEKTCGWSLTVDAASGFARLSKRAVEVDVSRPLRRTRGGSAPFDRRRYQLLCLVCAELVRHPVTTVGLLAAAVAADATLDTSRQSERAAFVDALRALIGWGAVRATTGEVEEFVDRERANALLNADTARLHRLLVCAAAPSSLPDSLDVEDVTARLLSEPRYGAASDDDAAGGGGEEARNRWARHRLGRRLLDDPVLYVDDLTVVERTYLASPSGRRWVRDRAQEAGFELEERAEGVVAVDPEPIATDRQFPAPLGNVHQLALLLVDRLVVTGTNGRRTLGRLTPAQLRREVETVLARFRGWAKGQRDDGGPDRLAREAVDLLVSFGLARVEADGTVVALPALARYRGGEPRVTGMSSTLFEEQE